MYQRRFQFFDKEQVVDPATKKSLEVFQKMKIQCCGSGRGRLVIGETHGIVNILDREFNLDGFAAYTGTIHFLVQIVSRNVLVTVGQDKESATPSVKIWNMDKEDKGGSRLLKTIKLQQLPDKATVSSFAVLDDVTQVVVGLSDGSVLFISGDLLRESSPKQRVILERSGAPVTGLGFRQHLSGQSSSVVLFVSTAKRVVRIITSNRDCPLLVLDELGCAPNCSTMSDTQEFAIGREEAIYFYEPEGRGACRPFEGTKIFVTWFRSYLVVVSEDPNSKQHQANIYDLANQYNAFSQAFPNVTHVVSEWGQIFLFCVGGKLFRLEEKDTQTKLETLFMRKLYNVAISVAQTQNADEASIIDIHRKFADHQYQKADFDQAIESYVRTIGFLEPSYVIRKFLDAQRIHNLTTYLQALHQRGVANADHTTLLLNCYTKLKDIDKLNEFIRSGGQELSFEVETAIKVCRQAGYHEHALYLAKRHNEHKWYLKILLEDLKDYTTAVKYIRTLPFFEAETNLKQYGKALLAELPLETTQLLKDLCTKYEPTVEVSKGASKAPPALAHHASGGALAVAQHGLGQQPLDLDLDIDMGPRKTHPKALPDEYLHIFVEKEQLLVEFLESVCAVEECSPIVYTTLLEAYLREQNEEVRLKKVLSLLINPRAKFDNDQALVLCQMYHFGAGVLVLYQKMELYQEIVSHYMEQKEYKGVIDACTSFGERDPALWVQALSYFAREPNECDAEIRIVLKRIEELNLLSPLRVIQMLSVKPTATLSVIKDFIIRNLGDQNSQIEEDQAEIRKFKEKTRQMRQEIEELSQSAKVFQQNKCSGCKNALDLPSVHFLCMHSFHQSCIENDNECPICAQETHQIVELKRSLQENATDHDAFYKQLHGAKDGFGVVAEFFSRGMFMAQPPKAASKVAPKAAPRK